MRYLPFLFLLACPTDGGDTDAIEKPHVECEFFCETAECPAIEICQRLRGNESLDVWIETGEGHEFGCNGSDCTSGTEAAINYCGVCL